MTASWFLAIDDKVKKEYPDIIDIIKWAGYIERENKRGFRTCNVRVGDRICPDWREVDRLINKLWSSIKIYTPDEFYIEFEKIHPFVDGNGRVGKILHNWLNGTLDDPILVKDYFGGGNP
jgi:fido (protein-threonine AMPylation protein)